MCELVYYLRMKSTMYQFSFSTGLIFFVSGVCYLLSGSIGYQTTALILLLAIAFLSLFAEIRLILFAALLSSLIWNFFFIPPRFTFTIGSTQDELMFLSYFIIAAITGILTVRIRIREERATALFTLTRQLTSAKNQDEVAETAVKNITTFFHSEVAIFLSQPDGDIFTQAHPKSTYAISEKEFSVAAWVYWNEKKAGKFTDTLPFATATYFPITGPRYPLGVIGVKPNSGKQFSIDQESLLQNFIAQIASTLEREQLNEHAKRTIAYAESEKLYKTLFNSISHELRTPIAAIVNASEALNSSNQKELVEEIDTAADRLNRLVENLLDMARLESGLLAPKKDWCNIRDIVNTSLKKLQKELLHHKVMVAIPDTLPLIKLDFGLIEQTITNLLHNASQYTPPETSIEISAAIRENECVITIHDHGVGFSKDAQNKIFEKFYRAPGTKAGGTGLGLSIVKGFIEAHKGTITASNHASGGALFEMTLPLNL